MKNWLLYKSLFEQGVQSKGVERLKTEDMTIAGVELKGLRLDGSEKEKGLKQFLDLLETERGVRTALVAIVLEKWDEASAILEPILKNKPNNQEAVRMYSAYCYSKAMQICNKSNNLDNNNFLKYFCANEHC